MEREPKKEAAEGFRRFVQTVWKHLLAFLKWVKHEAGILLVDNLMRSIVLWYDKRHPKASPKRRLATDSEVQRLQNVVADKEKDINGLRARLDRKEQEQNSLKAQLQQSRDALAQAEKARADLQGQTARLNDELNRSKAEASELRRRCLPADELPAMVYYAQGNASGPWLRKVSTTKRSDHYYRMETTPGDTATCSFRPIVQDNVGYIIANRNVTLLACDILGIAAKPTTIEVVEDGQATLDNDNKWKVTRKAKIKLV